MGRTDDADARLGAAIASISAWAGDAEPPAPEELALVRSVGPVDGERAGMPRLWGAAAALVVIGLLGGGLFLVVRERDARPGSPDSQTSGPDPSVGSTSPETPTTPTESTSSLESTSTLESTPSADPASSVTTSPVTTSPVESTLPPQGALAPAAAWFRASAAPLSPRNEAVGVWTGTEVLVFGGTDVPMCPVCDYAEPPDGLHDGAAYDPATDTWRSIADVPAEINAWSGVALLLGREVIYMPYGSSVSLWAYSLADDEWTALPLPDAPLGSVAIAAHGGRLVLYSRSDERSVVADHVLDRDSGTWSVLPDDPLEPSFDRTMLSVGGSLVLFARPIAGVSDSSRPTVVQAARFDESAGTWVELPASDQLDPPIFADGTTAIAPYRGGADGGQVNGWGRLVPFGGTFDVATSTWSRLPGETRKDLLWNGGAVGLTGATFTSVTGEVLDVVGGQWVPIPALPDGDRTDYGQTIVAAGTDLFVFGGGDNDSNVHDAALIWRTGRSG